MLLIGQHELTAHSNSSVAAVLMCSCFVLFCYAPYMQHEWDKGLQEEASAGPLSSWGGVSRDTFHFCKFYVTYCV